MKNEGTVTKAASVCIIVAFFLLVLYLFFDRLLFLLFPFLIAYAAASCVLPLAKRLAAKTKTPLRVVSCILIFVFLFALGYGIASLIGALFVQLGDLANALYDALGREDNFIRRALDFFSTLQDKIPLLDRLDTSGALGDGLYDVLSSTVKEAATSLSVALTTAATRFVASLPNFLFSLFVALIATFYLAIDSERISAYLAHLIPPRARETIATLKTHLFRAIGRYLRAYLFLMGITFAELLAGFLFLNVRYALLYALVIALLDMLPVIGVGMILIPWGVYAFISGQMGLGIGLLVLYAAVTVIRQIIEPKIVGDSMGIHPLATLASVYVGYSLFGLAGLVAGPIVVFAAKVAIAHFVLEKEQ